MICFSANKIIEYLNLNRLLPQLVINILLLKSYSTIFQLIFCSFQLINSAILESKFHNFSLQGITGIIFGIISIIFIWFIKILLNSFSLGDEGVGMLPISFFEILMAIVALIYILICYFTIVLINKKRRKKLGLKGWEYSSKKIRNIFISFLITGGILTYSFVSEGNLKLIIPTSLILFGIASVITNKYTNSTTNIFGILFIVNGIVAILFPQFMFYVWGVAFGIYPIIYSFYTPKKNN